MTTTDLGVLALAAAIRSRREQIRLNRDVAAHLAGMEDSDLRSVEAGQSTPSSWQLSAIARALRTTPDMLRGRADLLAADHETEVPA